MTLEITETSKGGGSPYSRAGSLKAGNTWESPRNFKGTVPGLQVALGQEGPAGSRCL